MSKPLYYLTVQEAIDKFKTGELSPVAVMESVIDRCESINSKLNAITDKFYDQALAKAKEAESRYKNGTARPLEGIPLASKALHPIKGVVTTWGSKVFEDDIADRTLPALQRLFDAGAILHIRTTTPEFAHAGHCHSPLYGTTRNPWNLEYSSCGSSGGSGVAVATGMAFLGTADDGAGSIRMPASANGVVGYKPPTGRNPACLLDTYLETIIHIGVISRDVDDAAVAQNIMNGQHPEDPISLPGKLEIPLIPGEAKGLKVAFSSNLGYFEIDSGVAQITKEAAAKLRELGCEVGEVDIPWGEEVYDAELTYWESLFAALMDQHMPRWQFKMDPYVRKIALKGRQHSAMKLKQTEFLRTKMWGDLQKIFAQYDVLICPTLAAPGIKADHKNDDPDFKINGQPVDAYFEWALTYPFNLLSQAPAITVPSGFTSNNIPTGLQIIGNAYDDLSVFRAARVYQQGTDWHLRHPEM